MDRFKVIKGGLSEDGMGTTEIVEYKQRINLQGVKRYWRVAFTPDLNHTSADIFTLGGGVVVIGGEFPLTQ